MKRINMLTLSVLMVFGLLGLGAAVARAADVDHAMMGDKMTAGDAMKPMAAVGGFCPVCLIHGMTMKGSDNYVTEYKGKLYKFSSFDMQKAFVDNPEMIAKDAEAKFK